MAEIGLVRQMLEAQGTNPTEIASPSPNPNPNTPIFIAETMAFPPALDRLCQTFSLSTFERRVLVFCAGMELDPTFERLCQKVAGDAQRAYPTFQLAMALFSDFHWTALRDSSPLHHYQLIEVRESPLISSALRIDRSVLYYLMGQPYRDPYLFPFFQELNSLETSIPLSSNARETIAKIENLNVDRTSQPPTHLGFAEKVIKSWGWKMNKKPSCSRYKSELT